MLERCWFDRSALSELLAEAQRWRLRETGGALLGWHEGRQVVVRQVLGPGPQAKHGFSYFEPDHEWQGEQGRKIYENSGRTIAYVGDWHTHPRGRAIPSRQDRTTMAMIAEDKDFRAPNALAAIVGRRRLRRGRGVVIYCWNGQRLVPVKFELFDAQEQIPR